MFNTEIIDNYIDNLISEEYSMLASSMRYSLMTGGKRIRPTLTMEFAQCCGADIEKVLPLASAIELIHTYSLIHDDLPCMDNDTLRRGKPTNHVVYGECTATLAGDALQPLAFEVLMSADIPAENKVRCASILADAAGYKGMCGGQYLDMVGEGKDLTEKELTEINKLKTGALISAACQMGVACVCLDEEKISLAKEFGILVGLAFQIRDDILDEGEENKNTYVVLLGKDKCIELISELSDKAISMLYAFENPENLVNLVKSLENRLI